MDIYRPDGSKINLNRDVNYRKKLTTQQTITPSPAQKIRLANAGLQWVRSSNVSGVGVQDDNLIIRFHNGSLYAYKDKAKDFDNIMKANSKGHWVWVHLRRQQVPYMKIGSLKFDTDTGISDEEVFNLVDKKGLDIQERLQAMGLFIAEDLNVLNLVNLSDLI